MISSNYVIIILYLDLDFYLYFYLQKKKKRSNIIKITIRFYTFNFPQLFLCELYIIVKKCRSPTLMLENSTIDVRNILLLKTLKILTKTGVKFTLESIQNM